MFKLIDKMLVEQRTQLPKHMHPDDKRWKQWEEENRRGFPRKYTPSAELLATGKTEWEENEFEVGDCRCSKGDVCPSKGTYIVRNKCLVAYPVDEVNEDDWELESSIEAKLYSCYGNAGGLDEIMNVLSNYTITRK